MNKVGHSSKLHNLVRTFTFSRIQRTGKRKKVLSCRRNDDIETAADNFDVQMGKVQFKVCGWSYCMLWRLVEVSFRS